MNIEYTTKDFDNYFEEFKQKAIDIFGNWNTFNQSNIGVLFLELLAMLGEQDSFYLNKYVNELFIMTVTNRKNAIRLFRGVGYTIRGRNAATVDITFSIKSGIPIANDIVIPKGYTVKSSDGAYSFETTEEGTIIAGQVSVIIPVANYVTKQESVSLNGEVFQEIQLQEKNFIRGYTELVIDGMIWYLQENLLYSSDTDRDFYEEEDDEIYGYIKFGNGVKGKIPDGTGTVTYKYGGGVGGNDVQANTITKTTDTIYDVLDNQVDITVNNTASPTGGQDEESIEEARLSVRYYDKVSYTITREQHEKHAEEVIGVARVLALSKTEAPEVAINVTAIYIVPVGLGVPSSELKAQVDSYLKTEKPIVHSTGIFEYDPVYKLIDISGTVTKNINFTEVAVKTAIDSEIVKYFNPFNLKDTGEYTNNFGFYKPKVTIAEIYTIIMNTKINGVYCVDNVTLSTPLTDIDLTIKEYPKINDITGLLVV